MSDSSSPVRASAQEQRKVNAEAKTLWLAIARAEQDVFEDELTYLSVAPVIIAALTAAEARGRQQAEQIVLEIDRQCGTDLSDGGDVTARAVAAIKAMGEARVRADKRLQQAEQRHRAELNAVAEKIARKCRERVAALTQALKDAADIAAETPGALTLNAYDMRQVIVTALREHVDAALTGANDATR